MRISSVFAKRSLEVLVFVAIAAAFALWGSIPDQNNNTFPMCAILANSTLPPEDVNQQPVLVVLSPDVATKSSDKRRKVELAFINPMTVPFEYVGSTPESYSPRTPRGEINPYYRIEVKNESEWVEQEIVRCGYGMARLSVQPGQAGRFFVYLPRDDKIARVGIHCTWTTNNGTENKALVWGPELGPSIP